MARIPEGLLPPPGIGHSERDKTTILCTPLRSYNERPRHLCKVTRTLLPRAYQGSRYVRFCSSGMFDTEDVTQEFFLRSPLKEESAFDTPPLISNVGSWV